MKKFLSTIIVLLFSLVLQAQDYQISAMNGASVDLPMLAIGKTNAYVTFGTNYYFYKFPLSGIASPISSPVRPDPDSWGPYNADVAVSKTDENIVYSSYIDFITEPQYHFSFRYVKSTDGGTNWDTPIDIETVQNGSSISVRLDVPKMELSQNGNLYFLWLTYANDTDTTALFFKKAGGEKIRINSINQEPVNSVSWFVKNVNGTDHIIIAYAERTHFYFRISTDNGKTFSEAKSIIDLGTTFLTSENFSYIFLTDDVNYPMIFVYNSFNSGGSKALGSRDDGQTWDNMGTVENSSNYFDLDLWYGSTFVKTINKDNNIYVQSSSNIGDWNASPLSGPINTQDGSAVGDFPNAQFLDAEIDPTNEMVYVAWVDNRTGNNEIFYGKQHIPPLTGVENVNSQLTNFELFQNYPNPFNPETTIKYNLKVNSTVKIQIYNALGKLIKNFDLGLQNSGFHSVKWNGTDDAGIKVASGMYIYKIFAGNFVSAKKMILMK